jgi:hypothetical protein
MRCGTPTRPICGKLARICRPFRSCRSRQSVSHHPVVAALTAAPSRRAKIHSTPARVDTSGTAPVLVTPKTRAAVVSRPTVEVADIVYARRDTFVEQFPCLSVQQGTVLRAIARSRTTALGGHVDRCNGLRLSGHFVLVSESSLSEVPSARLQMLAARARSRGARRGACARVFTKCRSDRGSGRT